MWKRQGEETKEFKRGTTGLVHGSRISKKMAIGLGVMMGLIATTAIVVPITVIAANTTTDKDVARMLNKSLEKLEPTETTTLTNKFLEDFKINQKASNGESFGLENLDTPKGTVEEWTVTRLDYQNELLEVRIHLKLSVDKASANVYKNINIAGLTSQTKIADDYLADLEMSNEANVRAHSKRSFKNGADLDAALVAASSDDEFLISELNALFTTPLIDKSLVHDPDNIYANVKVYIDYKEIELFTAESQGLGKKYELTFEAKVGTHRAERTKKLNIVSLDRHSAGEMSEELNRHLAQFTTKLPENQPQTSIKSASTLNTYFANNPDPQPYELDTDSPDAPNMKTALGLSVNLVKTTNRSDSCYITFRKMSSVQTELNVRFTILLKIQFSNSSTYTRNTEFTLVSSSL